MLTHRLQGGMTVCWSTVADVRPSPSNAELT